jgi:hypothetical protein
VGVSYISMSTSLFRNGVLSLTAFVRFLFSCSERIKVSIFLPSFNCFPIYSNGFLWMSLLMFDLLRLGKP